MNPNFLMNYLTSESSRFINPLCFFFQIFFVVNPPINPPEKTWRFVFFVQADASKAGIGLFLCAHRLGGLHRMLGTKAGTKHGDFC